MVLGGGRGDVDAFVPLVGSKDRNDGRHPAVARVPVATQLGPERLVHGPAQELAELSQESSLTAQPADVLAQGPSGFLRKVPVGCPSSASGVMLANPVRGAPP